MTMPVVRSILAALCLTGALAGCTAETGNAGETQPDARAAAARWYQPCPEPAGGARAGRSPAPAVTLECLGGGGKLDLGTPLGKPVVVNVWASWCRPCREELPALQRYADRMKGKVLVLGVVHGDTYPASLALAKELEIRLPTLYDREGALMKAVGRTALPVTLFIDGTGRLAYVYNGEPLTEASLGALVDEHLAVT